MSKMVMVTSALVLLLVGGILVIKNKDKLMTTELTNELVMDLNRAPLACDLEKQKVKEISTERMKVKNSNHLGFWSATFESGESTKIITNNESPYQAGQTFLVATNCKTMKSDQTIPVRVVLAPTKDPKTGHEVTNYEEKYKTQEEIAQNECVNIYVWNKDKGQMKLECVQLVEDKVYLLKAAQSASKEETK